MTSREYWLKREAEQRKKNITDEAECQKKLKRIYEDMLDSIQKEIDEFYARYADKEGITLAEAKRRVAQLDIDAYNRKAERYVRDKDFSEQANEEMRLYNLTMKITRLEMLKANIGLELVSSFDELQKYFEQKLTDRTLSEFERQAGILGEFPENSAIKARSIVNASFHNATFSERIWMYQDLLKAELWKLLQTGLIQGKGSRELARMLRQKIEASRSDAERLMTTELRRVQTDAAKQSYERNANEEYEFMAGNPKGACPICKALDGKVFKVQDMQPGKNAPPMHPRCHCATAPHWDEDEFQKWLAEENKKMHMRKNAVAGRLKSDIIMTDKQFGKKIGKHAQDYALNPSLETDREKMKSIISEIIDQYDEIRTGEWRGQPGISDFYIKGDDVVVINHDKFVTILKGGITNARIKNGRKREV